MEGEARAKGMQTVSRRWESQKQPSFLWVRYGECSKAALRDIRRFKNCRMVEDIRKDRSKEKQERVEGEQQ